MSKKDKKSKKCKKQYEPDINIILEEYRTLRDEIINTQGRRLQIISFTIGAYGVILSILGSAIVDVDPIQNADKLRTIIIGGMILLWSFLIPSLMMINAAQRSVDRKGSYIREFIEPNLPELRWETVWHDAKVNEESNIPQGTRSRGGLYIFMTLLPIILPFYAIYHRRITIDDLWFFLPLLLMIYAVILIIDYQKPGLIKSRKWDWGSKDKRRLNFPERDIFIVESEDFASPPSPTDEWDYTDGSGNK